MAMQLPAHRLGSHVKFVGEITGSKGGRTRSDDRSYNIFDSIRRWWPRSGHRVKQTFGAEVIDSLAYNCCQSPTIKWD